MPHLFDPLPLRSLTLRNRIALSPMCTYSCENRDGIASDWHVAHLAARAYGGTALVVTEATAVRPDGVISPEDLGIWSDDHIPGLTAVTTAIRRAGAHSCIQLAHSGRKAGTYRPWSPVRGYLPDWPLPRVSASPIPFREGTPTPEALSLDGINQMVSDWVAAADRAHRANFDSIELHSAHGYFLHQFLSPLSNTRTDAYGGSYENRTRLHRELVTAVRTVWPEEKPLLIRISATDWVEGGWTIQDTIRLAQDLMPLGLDLLDCSSGGTVMDAPIPTGPGYQVHLAEAVKQNTPLPSAAVGQITTPEQANLIVTEGRADLIMIGREMLRNPHWAVHAAQSLGHSAPWPNQYSWAV